MKELIKFFEAQPTTKELSNETGKKVTHIHSNKNVKCNKMAQAYQKDVLSWQLKNFLAEIKANHKDLIDPIDKILLETPKSNEVLGNFIGVTKQAIGTAKKRREEKGAYAYNYYLLLWRVDKIKSMI